MYSLIAIYIDYIYRFVIHLFYVNLNRLKKEYLSSNGHVSAHLVRAFLLQANYYHML